MKLPAVALLAFTLAACNANLAPRTPSVPIAPVGPGTSWADPSTWGGVVPGENASVTIPEGKTVTLDRSATVRNVTVYGNLVWADKDGLELRTGHLMVHGPGSFRVGSEAQPFTKKATITLTGNDATENVMGMGTKFLGAMAGGRIELHGEARTNWLRLDATAQAGATTLTLERDPGWRVGERLVIAPSGYNALEAEERTITAASGRTVTVDSPLQYRHFGEAQTVEGTALEERAEVGLLTRNIVVTSDTTRDNLGGHVMVMVGSSARFSGVEFARLGQLGRMGRYGGPHWHLVGDASGQYVRGSSIHHTLNRFGSVHATNNLRLEDNVAFDTVGHGWILEDGVETGNVFEGNLAMLARPPVAAPLIPSDTRPSTYWMANPDNTFRGNVAAGSLGGNGFWYELPERPTGVSSGSSVRPQRAKFGVFEDNVAHSNGMNAKGFEVGAGLRLDQYEGTTPMRGLTSYRNFFGTWLASPTGSSTHLLEGFRFSGNLAQTIDIDSLYTNALFVGVSGNRLPIEPQKEGLSMYDGYISLRGAVIANFDQKDRFLTFRSTSNGNTKVSSYSGLRFVNFKGVRADFTSFYEDPQHTGLDPAGREMLFDDADGSLTGGEPSWIVYRNLRMLVPGCTQNTQVTGIGSYICPKKAVGYLRVGAGFTDEGGPAVQWVRDDGATVAATAERTWPASAFPYLPVKRSYRAVYSGSATDHFSAGSYYLDPSGKLDPSLSAAEAWVHLVTALPNWGNVRSLQNVAPQPNLAALETCTANCFHFDPGTRTLHVKMTAATSAQVFERVP